MKNIFLLLKTIRYLKWQQIYFRIFRHLKKPKITETFCGSKPQRSETWKHLTLYGEKIDFQRNACFLNCTRKLDLPGDWRNRSLSTLWVYNLHYFEDLLSDTSKNKVKFHQGLIKRWIDENPVGYGIGWEPYPTSLRIVNILKAWLGGLELEQEVLVSVFGQASYLSNNLEKHLLGNHYFVNLKALLFGGVIFQNNRWRGIAERGLISQIPEQVLNDGGNFELSPMYHSLMLVDMLDLLNLCRAYPGRVKNELVVLLETYIPKMLKFMEAMSHPDGGVSFFNDSVDEIAPAKEKIELYAQRLNFDSASYGPDVSQALFVVDNASSGYVCASFKRAKLIFDAANVGPDYIPAHAHADTLSFELSIGSQRVFVNSGISEYGSSQTRLNQRATAAHNTVEVDGKNSSQVWSGFRVAGRAGVIKRSYEICSNHESVVLCGAHNGYKKLVGGCIHARKIKLSSQSLSVVDSLLGCYGRAKARFHIHPDLKAKVVGNLLTFEGRGITVTCNIEGVNARLVDAVFSPAFGVKKNNTALEVELRKGHLEMNFAWTMKNTLS